MWMTNPTLAAPEVIDLIDPVPVPTIVGAAANV